MASPQVKLYLSAFRDTAVVLDNLHLELPNASISSSSAEIEIDGLDAGVLSPATAAKEGGEERTSSAVAPLLQVDAVHTIGRLDTIHGMLMNIFHHFIINVGGKLLLRSNFCNFRYISYSM